MGLFDRIFKGGDENLQALKNKYQTVFSVMQQQGVQVQETRIQDGKLLIKGVAPSQDAKNRVWDQIKVISPSYNDLIADITVAAGAAQQTSTQATGQGAMGGGAQGEAVSGGAAGQAGTTGQGTFIYTVKSGDTLARLAQQFYGDAHQYMVIFNANRDQLSDPDLIKVGQQLKIPPKP